jgi:hypothetical protein
VASTLSFCALVQIGEQKNAAAFSQVNRNDCRIFDPSRFPNHKQSAPLFIARYHFSQINQLSNLDVGCCLSANWKQSAHAMRAVYGKYLANLVILKTINYIFLTLFLCPEQRQTIS